MRVGKSWWRLILNTPSRWTIVQVYITGQLESASFIQLPDPSNNTLSWFVFPIWLEYPPCGCGCANDKVMRYYSYIHIFNFELIVKNPPQVCACMNFVISFEFNLTQIWHGKTYYHPNNGSAVNLSSNFWQSNIVIRYIQQTVSELFYRGLIVELMNLRWCTFLCLTKFASGSRYFPMRPHESRNQEWYFRINGAFSAELVSRNPLGLFQSIDLQLTGLRHSLPLLIDYQATIWL